jgi:hypothetical protein
MKTGQAGSFASVPVKYSDNFPQIVPTANSLHELTIGALALKSREWNYEKEWRLIWSKHSNFPLSFLPGVVTAIYLGCNLSPNDRLEIVSRSKDSFPNTPVFQAVIPVDRFALEFKELR